MSIFTKALWLIPTAFVAFATAAIPPDWDAELLFDDFGDMYGDASDRTYTGAIHSYSQYESYTKGNAGYWYSYSSKSEGKGDSYVSNGAGEELTGKNIKTTIEASATDTCMHVNFVVEDNEEYCTVGANILAANTYVDLSTMTSVSFRAKGEGYVRFYFESKFVKDEYGWGHLGSVVELTSAWETFTIDADDFYPAFYSDAEADGVTWSDCKDKISAFCVEATAGDEELEKESAELYIDDIKFVGMKYSDIIEPVSIRTAGRTITNRTGFSVNGRSLTYTIAQPQRVSFSIVDLSGNAVSQLSGAQTAGTHTILMPANLSAGNYIVKMNGMKGTVQPFTIVR